MVKALIGRKTQLSYGGVIVELVDIEKFFLIPKTSEAL